MLRLSCIIPKAYRVSSVVLFSSASSTTQDLGEAGRKRTRASLPSPGNEQAPAAMDHGRCPSSLDPNRPPGRSPPSRSSWEWMPTRRTRSGGTEPPACFSWPLGKNRDDRPPLRLLHLHDAQHYCCCDGWRRGSPGRNGGDASGAGTLPVGERTCSSLVRSC